MTNQIDKLKDYCNKMLLDFRFDDELLIVNNDELYLIITETDKKLFDEELKFLPDEELEEGIAGWVYEFGGRWYINKRDEELSLTELKNIGKAKQKLPTQSFLGIRSGYELMNGVGLYKDWIKKAKFLGVKTLAICERNTLSGVLIFQSACKADDIKSIIGMTVSVFHNKKTFDVKLYVKSYQGWLNLLKFNSQININKETSVSLDFLLQNREDLFIIADPKSMEFDSVFEGIDYYQLDTVIFENPERDEEYLSNLEHFMKSELKPISITDAFYIEEADVDAREALWDIAKAYDDKSKNQYFKNKDRYAKELILMFKEGSKTWITLYKQAIANEEELVVACNYQYDTSTRHLPRYEMTAEEAEKFENNEELFLHLIKKGFKEKLGDKDAQKYVDRLKMEINVLKQGDVIDYFLSLYDIMTFTRDNNMMTGVGRGSAGGSLIAYLLDIIKINPLDFGLLFERFLNLGRMGEWVECPLYIIELENGTKIELLEGELVRIKRNGKETAVQVHELLDGDEIIRY
jgi:DNA polymerase-3 subunit alpha